LKSIELPNFLVIDKANGDFPKLKGPKLNGGIDPSGKT
jgi:hypothetical protein